MFVIVETFLNPGEPSDAQYRVRPVEEQPFPATMRVQCLRAMRQAFPIGSCFRLPAELVKNKPEGRCLRDSAISFGAALWTPKFFSNLNHYK